MKECSLESVKRTTAYSGILFVALQVAAASFAALARFGTGGFAAGYKSELVPDDGKYGVATISGRRVSETSKVRFSCQTYATYVGILPV